MVANGIAAVYSLLQSVRCVVGTMKGRVLFSKPLAWAFFSGDQVSLVCVSLFPYILFAKISELDGRFLGFGFVILRSRVILEKSRVLC